MIRFLPEVITSHLIRNKINPVKLSHEEFIDLRVRIPHILLSGDIPFSCSLFGLSCS